MVARYGGEEMVALLPETDLKGAAEIAEKIRREVEQHEFSIPGPCILHITASLGAAALTPDSLRWARHDDLLVKWADKALYAAKHGGRNRVKTMEEESGENTATECRPA